MVNAVDQARNRPDLVPVKPVPENAALVNPAPANAVPVNPVPANPVPENAAPANAAQQLSWFEGEWEFDRGITDRATGARHRVTGTAEFIRPSQGSDPVSSLIFVEQGTLRSGHGSAAVQRRLSYHADTDALDIRFAHGGHYLTFDLSGGSCTAEHLCPPDTYLIAVSIHGPNRWTEHWQVTGPMKDYSATTAYRRIQGSSTKRGTR